MKAKGLKTTMIISLLAIKFPLKMAPLVKLVVISKSGKEASFLQKSACLSSSSLYSSRKQPYLVSTSSYQLSVKAFYCLCASNCNGVSHETKWRIVIKIIHLLYWIIR